MFERGNLSVELPTIDSLKTLDTTLDQVTWTMDGPLHLYDSISYPQTVWAKKKDDCDGFAVLAAELLKRFDPQTAPVLMTVMLRPAGKSHTVCVFRHSGALRITDNKRVRAEEFADYAEAARYVAQRGTQVVCWDIADPWSLSQLEFHRTL